MVDHIRAVRPYYENMCRVCDGIYADRDFHIMVHDAVCTLDKCVVGKVERSRGVRTWRNHGVQINCVLQCTNGQIHNLGGVRNNLDLPRSCVIAIRNHLACVNAGLDLRIRK